MTRQIVRRLDLLGLVPALATLIGCAGAGISAHGADEPAAPVDVVVAVLPAVWATDTQAAGATSTELASALDRAPGVRIVDARRVESSIGAEVTECAADFTCVRRVGEQTRSDHVVVVELAELGGTVLVRASVVDVDAGTRAATRQEVVQRADGPRIEAALARLGAAIAAEWAPPPAAAPEETEWHESAGFWVAVAGVAVAAATVTTVVLVTGESGQEPDGTITPP